jgi:hypothetical protein
VIRLFLSGVLKNKKPAGGNKKIGSGKNIRITGVFLGLFPPSRFLMRHSPVAMNDVSPAP